MNSQRRLIYAAGMLDGAGHAAQPAAILLEGHRIVAAGRPESVGGSPDWVVERRRDEVLLPALVNAHCHLDLTHIGPVPYPGDFVSFVDVVRSQRAVIDAEIQDSAERGIQLSRNGGTGAMGDIAGAQSIAALRAMREFKMAGVGFVEVFGLGASQSNAIERMRQIVANTAALKDGVRLGLQPHAPYSCGPDVFRAAAGLGAPLSTHLAETLAELEFVAEGTGPITDMLRRIGVWDHTIKAHGCHSVEYIRSLIGNAPIIAAHVNYVDDEQIELLRNMRITVAYCPRASEYFGHPHDGRAPHQYRQMIEAGVNVALGTDSIMGLDTPDRISVLDEMRLLYRRDGVNPQALLKMGTINGARALGLNDRLFQLAPAETAGILGVKFNAQSHVDPVHQIMSNEHSPSWVFGPVVATDSWHLCNLQAFST